MAVYLNGLTDVLHWIPANFPITGIPFTLSCFGKTPDTGSTKNLLSIADKDDSSYHAIRFRPTTDAIQLITKNEDNSDDIIGGPALSYNTWYHVAGVFASVSSRILYVDGSSYSGSSNISPEPDNLDVIEIGRAADSSPYGEVDHTIAEAAAWNVALTPIEIGILTKGFSPLFVRPQNLVFYCPLVRGTNELISGESLSSVTPAWVEHCGVIRPAPINVFGYVVEEEGITVDCTLGTIIIDGKNASLSVGTDVDSTLGAVSIAGLNPEVSQGIGINCTLGEISISGLNADISEGINIDCTLGQINVDKLNADISVGTDIKCSLGAVSISGLNASVDLGTVINCTVGNINIDSLNPAVSIGTDIEAGLGTVNITGFDADINLGVTIDVAVGAIVIDGKDANVQAGVAIDCSLGAIDIAGLNADISLPTNIDCTKGDITVSSLNADIVSTVLVDVTLGQLDISGLNTNIILPVAIAGCLKMIISSKAPRIEFSDKQPTIQIDSKRPLIKIDETCRD